MPLSLGLSSRPSNEWSDPAYLTMLLESYRRLEPEPAWGDFFGTLQELRSRLERALLRGAVGKDGRDTTEAARAVYGVLTDLAARAGVIEAQLKKVESHVFGGGAVGPALDPSKQQWYTRMENGQE